MKHRTAEGTKRRPAHQERKQQAHHVPPHEALHEVQQRQEPEHQAGDGQQAHCGPVRPRTALPVPHVGGEDHEDHAGHEGLTAAG